VRNEVEDNKEIEECVRSLATGIEKIKAKGVSFTMDVNKMTEDGETNMFGVPEFGDITEIKCKYTLSDNEKINGVQYVASCYFMNQSVVLWNLVDLSKVGMLGNSKTSSVYAESLASFKKDNLHILAVGCSDGNIKLWNLVSREVICTLRGHVYVLQVMEIGERMYLISGNWDGAVKVWDIDSYIMLKSFKYGIRRINTLQTFAKNDKSYVAVGGDNGVEVWCLTQYAKVAQLDKNSCDVLAATKNNGRMMLAGGSGSEIKVWNLEDFGEEFNFSDYVQ